MMPKISIITPVFNSNLDFFNLAYESVRNQTLPRKNFEWIILDDGSITNISPIIKDLVVEEKNFRFYKRLENKGPSVTRNEAINFSRANLIVMFDSDDILLPSALEQTLDFHKKNPNIQYSYSMMNVIDEEGNVIEKKPSFYYNSERLMHFNYVGHLKCFSKDLHTQIKGFNPNIFLAQDWDHILKASEVLDEKQIVRNPVYLYNYREHLNGISKGNQKIRREFIAKFLTEFLKRRGINKTAYWSHKTEEGYNYYDWRKE